MSFKIAVLVSLMMLVSAEMGPTTSTLRNADDGSSTCAGNENSCTSTLVEDEVGLLQVQLEVERKRGNTASKSQFAGVDGAFGANDQKDALLTPGQHDVTPGRPRIPPPTSRSGKSVDRHGRPRVPLAPTRARHIDGTSTATSASLLDKNARRTSCVVGPFDIGYGGCFSYAPGLPNHHYCEVDMDQSGNYAFNVCQECGRCTGGITTPCIPLAAFDAGYGGCDTYAHGSPNYPYCNFDHDAVSLEAASAVCSECGQCSDGPLTPLPSPSPSPPSPSPSNSPGAATTTTTTTAVFNDKSCYEACLLCTMHNDGCYVLCKKGLHNTCLGECPSDHVDCSSIDPMATSDSQLGLCCPDEEWMASPSPFDASTMTTNGQGGFRDCTAVQGSSTGCPFPSR